MTLPPTARNDSTGCGAIQSISAITYALTGLPAPHSGLAPPAEPLPLWSDVIPKEKLVYAVGWYNTIAPLHPEKCPKIGPCGDIKYGGEPSYSIAHHLASLPGNKDKRWMNFQGSWVMDRTDATCPLGCRMFWDDADSLLPKYKAVKDAGWAGVGMWQANGMFPGVSAASMSDPGWMNVYDAKAMGLMWQAIADAWE
jgi:hypothetical protein